MPSEAPYYSEEIEHCKKREKADLRWQIEFFGRVFTCTGSKSAEFLYWNARRKLALRNNDTRGQGEARKHLKPLVHAALATEGAL